MDRIGVFARVIWCDGRGWDVKRTRNKGWRGVRCDKCEKKSVKRCFVFVSKEYGLIE